MRTLHLGHSNTMYQDNLAADWLGTSFAEKDLGILVDGKLGGMTLQ